MKECSSCKEVKPLSDFYSHNKRRKDNVEYIYYNPECKECTISRSSKWIKDNPEKFKVAYTKYDKKPAKKVKNRIASRKHRESGKYREWQKNNTDKTSAYNNKHQNHDITEDEWLECLEFFNFSCVYCGLKEDAHTSKYYQRLHKDHIAHDGNNYIDNCVPACKTCNSSKNVSQLNDWYNENNPTYSKRRLNKIIKWVMSFTEEYAQ